MRSVRKCESVLRCERKSVCKCVRVSECERDRVVQLRET